MEEEWGSKMGVEQVVLTGKHIIKSARVTVKFLLELLTNG
jgi:hypothetical protein